MNGTLTITLATSTGGTISGMKYNDANRSRTKDAGEVGLAGWTIRLKNKDNTVVRTTVTDVNGNYSFTNLPAGTYKVKETHQKGWKRMTKNPAAISITSSSNIQNVNFGNAKKLTPENEDTNDEDDRDEQ